MLVGEIGVSHSDFMYRLEYWQVVVIIRGYRRRQQPLWEAARMNAFFSMAGTANLAQNGIHTDQDLIRFPWEKERGRQEVPDDDEVEEMRREIQKLNETAT